MLGLQRLLAIEKMKIKPEEFWAKGPAYSSGNLAIPVYGTVVKNTMTGTTGCWFKARVPCLFLGSLNNRFTADGAHGFTLNPTAAQLDAEIGNIATKCVGFGTMPLNYQHNVIGCQFLDANDEIYVHLKEALTFGDSAGCGVKITIIPIPFDRL